MIDCPHTTPIFRNDGVLIARTFNIRNGNFNELSASRVSEEEYRQRVARLEPQTGDVIFTREAPVGEAFIVPMGMRICLGQRTMLLRPDSTKAIASYVLAQIYSGVVRSRIEQLVAGTTNPHLNVADVRPFLMPVPSLPEQQGIAEILDTVDEAIARTSSLIIKLKQTKAGLQQDLLTRGLDEHGKLRDPQAHPEQFKDSPLEQIPRDWEIESLNNVCSSIVDCPHTTPVFQNEGILVARTSNIRDGVFNQTEVSYVSKKEYFQRIARLKPQSGDIIFTREAPVGEAFTIPKNMEICLGQRTMLLRPNIDKAYPDYLIAQIYSGSVRARINQLVGGTTNPHLNVADVRTFLLPVPSCKEQAQIASVLNIYHTRIRTEEAYLNKLKLQKQGLMQDLLTGKVRVRTIK
ncbi:MAG: restriction endonuclease subunit S [Trichormus sp.]